MDHQWTKSLREDNKYRGHRSKNPSFSSSLLDAIYRSIDEGEEEFVHYKETPKKKQVKMAEEIQENDDFRRACLIEKWMETKASEKVVKCKSVPDLNPNIKKQKQSNNNSNSIRYSGTGNGFHSASSSSDSSSGGFSSSEAESLYGSHRPKPIRTSFSAKAEKLERPLPSQRRSESSMYETRQQLQHHLQQQQAKQEKISGTHKQKHEGGAGGFNKTKTKAMKIYGELKKAKQPISPGGRLASFLNSLFTAGNAKKEKLSSSVNGIDDYRSERKTKSAQTSTCSSASSFSRSCLSKTPSSRGKPTDGAKRSVRFYPVSVIVDEDSRPCGHKSLHEQQQQQQKPKTTNSANDELKQLRVLEKNRRIEEAAREFLRDYQKKKIDVEMRDASRDYQDEDDDEDDAESCTSSDLFELDNLAAIGIDRYREELPVYETTHLQKNRAISKGFIM